MTTIPTEKAETRPENLARLQREVRALREQLRRTQRLATVGTMAAMVAHEFNNILTPIINYAHMARKNPAMVEKAILHAARGGERASAICKAILGMARSEDAPAEPVNLLEMIKEALPVLTRNIENDRIEISLKIDGELSALARRAELQQVLMNLIMNARTALLTRDTDRQIEISARPEGKLVGIAVRDNGEGIAPEDLDRVFQPFFTTRQAGESSEGHGLGLAICRDMINAAGGQISVASTLGEGTTFTIQLPA